MKHVNVYIINYVAQSNYIREIYMHTCYSPVISTNYTFDFRLLLLMIWWVQH